jgi:hypothetical protein
MAFQPLFRLGNQPVVVDGGFRSLLAFWIGGAGSVGEPSPTPEPAPPPEQGGAGRVTGPRGGSTGPAFPRRATRDLYRTYEPPPEQAIAPEPEAPKPEPVKLGELSATVLPQMMGLTVMHGQAEIDALAAQKRLQQQQMMEDEEAAIIAILAASIH